MHRIAHVEVLDDYRLDISFEDGVRGIVDVSDLAGRGVFAIWNDYDEFQKASIGSMGELLWPGEIDLCPDSLYLTVTQKKPEDVFPGLKHELARA